MFQACSGSAHRECRERTEPVNVVTGERAQGRDYREWLGLSVRARPKTFCGSASVDFVVTGQFHWNLDDLSARSMPFSIFVLATLLMVCTPTSTKFIRSGMRTLGFSVYIKRTSFRVL